MNHQPTLYLLLCLLTNACLLSAQNESKSIDSRKTLEIHKTHDIMFIDGKANEPSWQEAEIHTFDYYYKFVKPSDKQTTRFRMLWDDKNLYFLFESDDKYITARETTRDREPYFDDCAEVFLIPADQQINMHIGYEVNLYKATNDFIYINDIHNHQDYVIRSFDPAFQVAYTIDGTVNDNTDMDQGWKMEFAIPLHNFHIDGPSVKVKEGSVWSFMALRQDRNDPTGNRRSTTTLFPLLPEAYKVHNPQSFGRMLFVD